MTIAHQRSLHVAGLLVGVLASGGTYASDKANPASTASAAPATPVASAASNKQQDLRMWMTVGDRRFSVTVADNAAGRAFSALLPMTLDMADLNGNEKHVDLSAPLPAAAIRPGTIRNGDLMLYGTKTVVIFYSAFESSYSYTRLGRVDDPNGLEKALGRRDARVAFSRD